MVKTDIPQPVRRCFCLPNPLIIQRIIASPLQRVCLIPLRLSVSDDINHRSSLLPPRQPLCCTVILYSGCRLFSRADCPFFPGRLGFDLLCGAGRVAALECPRHSIHYRSRSNPAENSQNKAATPCGMAVLFWRTGWDSNPREIALKLISSQPRYDHFDTCPYCGGQCARCLAIITKRRKKSRTK